MGNNAASNKIASAGPTCLRQPSKRLRSLKDHWQVCREVTNRSLTRIQRGDLSALTSGNPCARSKPGHTWTTNVLRELRGTSLASSLGHIDSATLDIVALLFDQIFA